MGQLFIDTSLKIRSRPKKKRKKKRIKKRKSTKRKSVVTQTLRIRDSYKLRYLQQKGYGVRFLSPMVVQASFSHWSPQIRDVTTPAYVKVKHAERQYIVVRHVERVSTLNHPLLTSLLLRFEEESLFRANRRSVTVI